MTVRVYEDLTDDEQNRLSKAWLDIVKGLEVYGEITGAGSLDDMVYEALWAEILLQKEEAE